MRKHRHGGLNTTLQRSIFRYEILQEPGNGGVVTTPDAEEIPATLRLFILD
jgi:hypothetical protein